MKDLMMDRNEEDVDKKDKRRKEKLITMEEVGRKPGERGRPSVASKSHELINVKKV